MELQILYLFHFLVYSLWYLWSLKWSHTGFILFFGIRLVPVVLLEDYKKKCTFKMCIICLSIFPISSVRVVTGNIFCIHFLSLIWLVENEKNQNCKGKQLCPYEARWYRRHLEGMRKVGWLTMGQSQKCDKGDSSETLPFLIFLAVGNSFFLTLGLNS